MRARTVSRRRWGFWWIAALLAFAAVYLASARYGAKLSLGPNHAIGLAAGAINLQERNLVLPVLPGPGGVVPAPRPQPKQPPGLRFHFYRHEFTFVWWFKTTDLRPVRLGTRSLDIPLWTIAIAVALPWLAWKLIPRIPAGHCRNCGYDLRGTPSGTCPECGTPIRRID